MILITSDALRSVADFLDALDRAEVDTGFSPCAGHGSSAEIAMPDASRALAGDVLRIRRVPAEADEPARHVLVVEADR